MDTKVSISNEATTKVIEDCRNALYRVLAQAIKDPDVDFDKVLCGITYWFELQQLAKSYGKKLVYYRPKKEKKQ